MNGVVAFLIALVPSVGVLFIFWIGIKAIVEADRRERIAQARIEAAERRDNRADSGGVPISRSGATQGADDADDASPGAGPFHPRAGRIPPTPEADA